MSEIVFIIMSEIVLETVFVITSLLVTVLKLLMLKYNSYAPKLNDTNEIIDDIIAAVYKIGFLYFDLLINGLLFSSIFNCNINNKKYYIYK